MFNGRRARLGLLGVVWLLVVGLPSNASAAVTLGETFTPTDECNTTMGTTYLQLGSPPSPAPQFAAPTPGVITSWSSRAASVAPTQMKLKVGRPEGGNDLRIVGESDVRAPGADQLNTYPTRVAVQAGDVIGFFSTGGPGYMCARSATDYLGGFINADVQVGNPGEYSLVEDAELGISAELEPDLDHDGFGDETQDQCLGSAGDDLGCDHTAPQTRITKEPANKTAKHKVKYRFTSNEAGASFECKLDRKPYKRCNSPKKVRVGEGKHKFAVRATDAVGNVDSTPDKDKFKVV